MSDNPNKLAATLLEDCSTEQQRQFAKMLAEEIEKTKEQARQPWWFFPPSPKECAHMNKFLKDDTCPGCGKGRVIVEIHHGNIGQCFWLKCYGYGNTWGKGCGWKESCLDDDDEDAAW